MSLTFPYAGEILSLFSAIFWAFAVVLMKRAGETIHPVSMNLFKNLFVQNVLGLITSIYIYFVKFTSKIDYENISIPERYWKNNKPFILAFWHNQLMMISFGWRSRKKINILASGHSDGRFGAIVGNYLNLKNIQTSFNKQSLSMRPIFKLLKEKKYIGITPDGPRGPKEKVSSGIIKIASTTQVPIIAIGFASNRNTKLNSWDSFLVTYPFSRCAFDWSDPIFIPKNLKDEEIPKFQLLLENKINSCIESARLEISV